MCRWWFKNMIKKEELFYYNKAKAVYRQNMTDKQAAGTNNVIAA